MKVWILWSWVVLNNCFTASFLYGQDLIRTPGTFELPVGGGLVFPQWSGGRGGIGVTIAMEPMVFVNKNLSLGVRMVSASLSRNIRESGEGLTGDGVELSGISAVMEWHFPEYDNHPFLGVGVGFQSIALVGPRVTTRSAYINEETVFSTFLRAGIERRKSRYVLEYHFMGDTDFMAYNNHLDLTIFYKFTFRRKAR